MNKLNLFKKFKKKLIFVSWTYYYILHMSYLYMSTYNNIGKIFKILKVAIAFEVKIAMFIVIIGVYIYFTI